MSRNRALASILMAAFFVAPDANPAAAFENLSTWSQEQVCDAGFFPTPWQLQPGNTDVKTIANNNCLDYFGGDVAMSEGSMIIGHVGGDFDNDYFGLVLGFSTGETTNPNADYLLLLWASTGLALLHVEGNGCGSLEIVTRASNGTCRVKEIARAATLATTNWGHSTPHTFNVDSYTANSLTVRVDGVVQFDLTPYRAGLSCFPTGPIAFFAYSQANVQYGSVTVTAADNGTCAQACGNSPFAGGEFRVNDVTAATNSPSPQVTAGPDDAFLLGWGSGSDAYARRYESETLGPPLLVNSGLTTGTQMLPRFTATADGYWSVFSSDDTGYSQVFHRELDITGAPLGLPVRLSTQNGCHESGASLARSPSGGMMASWSAYLCAADPVQTDIFARGIAADGSTPAAPFQLSAPAAGVEQHAARVASTGPDEFVAFWRDAAGDGSDYAAIGRRISSGAPAGTEIQANVTVDGQQVPGIVLSRPEGGFFVLWQGKLSDGMYGIAGRFFSADGTPLFSEFQVGTRESSVQDEIGNVDAAALPGGGYVVVYYAPDSDQTGIFAQFLTADGDPASSEIRVNESSVDRQMDAHVAAASDGKILVTWATGATENASSQEIEARQLARCGTCGDGNPDPGETCDLGIENGQPGSGCDSSCEIIICLEGETCCGNGIREPGEECDDGNRLDGDCCAADCTAECPDDGNPCTQDCNPTDAQCGVFVAPASGCRLAGKSALGMKPGDNGKLQWKWGNGENTYCTDVGAPNVDTEFDLCVYDGSGGGAYDLASQFSLPASTLWTQKNCDWTYTDKAGNFDGLKKIKIKTGEPGRSSIGLKAGAMGPIPTPVSMTEYVNMDPDVVVQLHNSLGVCWESRFDTAKRNLPTKYRTNRLILIRQ